jgi:uncharacterized protein YbjT (DUF2867 family)
VIGASGRSGSVLCAALARAGVPVVAVVRDAAKWQALDLPGEMRVADLADAKALRAALAPARHVVSCAHARHTGQILAAAPADARFVLLGSTRRFTRWPDAHGLGVQAGEAALMNSGRDGVMLHPTMIYGARGEDNVQRLAGLLRRLPVVPLPDGGRSLVQPIHQDDLTACILAALDHPWQGPHILVVAGPQALRYRDFVAAIARAIGRPPPRIMPLPALLLRVIAPLTAVLPGLPRIRAAEIRRLTEDKAFSVAEMSATLGVTPMPLDAGLARTFAAPVAPAAPLPA